MVLVRIQISRRRHCPPIYEYRISLDGEYVASVIRWHPDEPWCLQPERAPRFFVRSQSFIKVARWAVWKNRERVRRVRKFNGRMKRKPYIQRSVFDVAWDRIDTDEAILPRHILDGLIFPEIPQTLPWSYRRSKRKGRA